MAEIKKPKGGKKGLPPEESDNTRNLEKVDDDKIVNLNLKVTNGFKKKFKAYCAEIDMDMKQVIVEFYDRFADELRK